MEFLHPAMRHNHDIDFVRWLHPAMRHVALSSWQWINLAMWYLALGWYAIKFARWQHPAMWYVALESWHWIRQVAAPCNLAGGSGMTCHWIRPKRPPYWNSTSGFDFDHITAVNMSFCTIVSKILSKSDHHRQKKWRHDDFKDGGSQTSWILGIQ